MRLYRPTTLFVRLLLLSLAASALQGAVIVTLSIQPNTLSDGQTASLKALVTGTTNTGVSWSFTPTVAGATIGPPAGPDATGTTTNSYKAPSPVNTTTTVTVTVTSLQDPSQTDSATITLRPVLDVGTGAPRKPGESVRELLLPQWIQSQGLAAATRERQTTWHHGVRSGVQRRAEDRREARPGHDQSERTL